MKPSPLRREHAHVARFQAVATGPTARHHQNLLIGERQFGWPLMALRTKSELGPCRHALSQMVVAGTMTVFPPFMSKPPVPDTDKGGSPL